MVRGYADAAPPPAKSSPGGAVAEKKDWEDLIDGLITGDEARRELATLKTAIMNFTAKVQEREKVWFTCTGPVCSVTATLLMWYLPTEN